MNNNTSYINELFKEMADFDEKKLNRCQNVCT